MDDTYELSVIIPTCPQRVAKLRTLLGGIAATSGGHEAFEVLVVVDEQDDAPLRAADVLPPSIAFSGFTKPHGGPAKARNYAIQRARGRWLLFYDDDVLVTEDTIPGHLRQIRRDPAAALAYLGRSDWPGEMLNSPWQRLLANSSMVFFWNTIAAGRLYGFRYFWSSNLSVPRELVLRVGGFCEEFPYALHEDLELGWRLQQLCGLQVCPVPAIVSWHNHALTPRDYFYREYKGGMVAALAARLTPDFYQAVWGWLGDPRQTYEVLHRLFAAPAAQVRGLLEDWANPSDYRPSAEQMEAVYQAHLPLKRLAFCHGCLGRPFDELWTISADNSPRSCHG